MNLEGQQRRKRGERWCAFEYDARRRTDQGRRRRAEEAIWAAERCGSDKCVRQSIPSLQWRVPSLVLVERGVMCSFWERERHRERKNGQRQIETKTEIETERESGRWRNEERKWEIEQERHSVWERGERMRARDPPCLLSKEFSSGRPVLRHLNSRRHSAIYLIVKEAILTPVWMKGLHENKESFSLLVPPSLSEKLDTPTPTPTHTPQQWLV